MELIYVYLMCFSFLIFVSGVEKALKNKEFETTKKWISKYLFSFRYYGPPKVSNKLLFIKLFSIPINIYISNNPLTKDQWKQYRIKWILFILSFISIVEFLIIIF
jgi:hypothetical protein